MGGGPYDLVFPSVAAGNRPATDLAAGNSGALSGGADVIDQLQQIQQFMA